VAAWQCDFLLVPASNAGPSDFAAGDVYAEWWTAVQPPKGFEAHIAKILPEGRSWSPDLTTWGIEDGTRVDVWREGQRVDSIRVRIDARALDTEVLRDLVALAVYCDAAFLRHDGLFVPATDAAFLSAIGTSAAARFVDDSGAFLRRIALGGPEDG
jgi:hypothetical protein